MFGGAGSSQCGVPPQGASMLDPWFGWRGGSGQGIPIPHPPTPHHPPGRGQVRVLARVRPGAVRVPARVRPQLARGRSEDVRGHSGGRQPAGAGPEAAPKTNFLIYQTND